MNGFNKIREEDKVSEKRLRLISRHSVTIINPTIVQATYRVIPIVPRPRH